MPVFLRGGGEKARLTAWNTHGFDRPLRIARATAHGISPLGFYAVGGPVDQRGCRRCADMGRDGGGRSALGGGASRIGRRRRWTLEGRDLPWYKAGQEDREVERAQYDEIMRQASEEVRGLVARQREGLRQVLEVVEMRVHQIEEVAKAARAQADSAMRAANTVRDASGQVDEASARGEELATNARSAGQRIQTGLGLVAGVVESLIGVESLQGQVEHAGGLLTLIGAMASGTNGDDS